MNFRVSTSQSIVKGDLPEPEQWFVPVISALAEATGLGLRLSWTSKKHRLGSVNLIENLWLRSSGPSGESTSIILPH